MASKNSAPAFFGRSGRFANIPARQKFVDIEETDTAGEAYTVDEA